MSCALNLPRGLSGLLAKASQDDLQAIDPITTELERHQEVLRCKLGNTVAGQWIAGPLYWLRFVMGDPGEPSGVKTFDEK